MRAWKRLGIGLLTTTMLIGGGMASAQKEQPKEPDPFQNLGLSADQRSKLETAKKDRMSALGASEQKMLDLRKRLVSLIFDKKASDKDIDQVVNQLGAADKEVLLSQIKFHKAIRQALTQEQLTTLSKGTSK
ncbi:Spy/CpxP family protein refolding chaperone [Candidatus Methylomirabilis sp.]|uniref:Spy/CpxP family protein refolding chaperone n=1 Tax=Candidatus Methylomirabilis sp. TaxID=2032687 RepID=UPI003C770678